MESIDEETAAQALEPQAVVHGSVDYRGSPALKSSSGGWTSASFIIGVEVAERCAYYGIESNLITYLTGSLGQSTVTAAANVNVWTGVSSLLPLVGGFVADSFFGRYHTIVISSLLYILGLGLLTLLAVLTSDSQNMSNSPASSPPQIYLTLFYLALYLVAIGQGGHKPCVPAFGADQFDGKDPEESRSKSSYFNWLYFSVSMAVIFTFLVMVYIQDNFGWALGFGIPCLLLAAALLLFLLGTKTYRYTTAKASYIDHPFVKIGRVFAAAVGCPRPRPVDRPLLTSTDLAGEVEEVKAVLRLIPIWASCLVYATVISQTSTFFTKQGVTMDRRIASNFEIPAASLQSFVGIAIILSIPVYDRVFIPITRSITRKNSGITTLQRAGIGMILSSTSMVIAALTEIQRLKTAEEYGLVDKPKATVPMIIWWLVPQYVLLGAANVFTVVGLQEFFYDQVPAELRSMGLSLYLSIFGVGSLLSSLLISAIDKANKGWFNDNLNQAHLDYFYWLLAGLSVVGFAFFFYSAKSYKYKREIE